MLYDIARNIIDITDADGLRSWQPLEWHYQPFVTTGIAPLLHISLRKGRVAVPQDMRLLHADVPAPERLGDVQLTVYTDAVGALRFEILQPQEPEAMASLWINAERTQAIACIDEDHPAAVDWRLQASTTSAIQLAFMLATMDGGTLMTHSSCILHNGRAYLFLGKSGTGKSTHSRMWLESVPGSVLLNDDHPVLRIGSDGSVTAYGSPWSGKTHCYKALEAPVGGIVRIKRAPANSIRALSPIEAYASPTTSLFNTPFAPALSDTRHAWIERVVMSARCYELHCLPDHDAAQVCLKGVS